eukprot:COSAG01_NODE_4063_length_5387_cov_5.413389_11_plen_174_part_00
MRVAPSPLRSGPALFSWLLVQHPARAAAQEQLGEGGTTPAPPLGMVLLMLLVSMELLVDGSPPRECRARADAPYLPIFHIIGNVTEGTPGGAASNFKTEAINDVSAVVKHMGVYHIFHQCCQVRSNVCVAPFAQQSEVRLRGFAGVHTEPLGSPGQPRFGPLDAASPSSAALQ